MARRQYLHLDLLIEPAGSGAYSARVSDSPVGAAGSLPIGLPSSNHREDPRDFGARLFDAVFRDRIREVLDDSVMEARRLGTGLRLRLRTGASAELGSVPWELLYDTRVHDFLALSDRTPLVRYLRPPARVRPPVVELPLRILAVPAGLSDRPSADDEAAWARLRNSLDELQRSGLIELERATGARVEVLWRVLSGSYHVLHVVGRGPGPLTGVGELHDLLPDLPTLRMAFLRAGTEVDRAAAEELVTLGMPAVVALQWEISEGAVGALARRLYEELAAGRPVDVALARARRTLHDWGGRAEWASPALYTSAPDGRIFDIAEAGRAAPPLPAPMAPAPTMIVRLPSPAPRPVPTAPAPGALPTPVFAAPPPGVEPPSLTDEDVQFSVFRPRTVSVGQWASLLVLAHKSERFVDPVRGVVDPLEEVRSRAQRHFGETPTQDTRVDARAGLLRGTTLRVVPDLPGATCNPPAAEFSWHEEVHEAAFRLRPEPHLAGSVLRGSVRIWCGPIIVGELPLAVPVLSASAEATAIRAAPVPDPAVRRYRKIFPSYSHLDRDLVQHFVTAANALGDQYLQDVLSLRPGEHWNERLLELIGEADVFQLFWSYNSMRSPYCRLEWERALALGRPSFVRPIYWEDPLPEDPQAGLPPQDLRALHFAHVPLGTTRVVARPSPTPSYAPGPGAPSLGAPAYETPSSQAPSYGPPPVAPPSYGARVESRRFEAPARPPAGGRSLSPARGIRLAVLALVLLALTAAIVLYVISR